jgi:hypothetical protein
VFSPAAIITADMLEVKEVQKPESLVINERPLYKQSLSKRVKIAKKQKKKNSDIDIVDRFIKFERE